MNNQHTFHIPVMGIAFSIDTPLKVAHLGIDSVISLVDDFLLEKLRKMYCLKNNKPYKPITTKEEDFRAKRITSYLNLINEMAQKKFEDFKKSLAELGDEAKKYFQMLPDGSAMYREFSRLKTKYFNFEEILNWLNENLKMGSIDVNIMTKVDKANYSKGKMLPPEFNDAHAALRGYAKSNLESSLILSAGINTSLYSYISNFEDFYPDSNGNIKKKIVLKVSDYRSALIQGKFFAKKGLWVSEFRIESGLNCGGHAFATDGFLMGPILSEFKRKKEELISTMHQLLTEALKRIKRPVPRKTLPVKITAQGGVGTAAEHKFLIEYYDVDSVGWGTPFLLVPEVTNVDNATIKLLSAANENNLYLSKISPLGVPFNSLRGNTKDIEKQKLIEKGQPGSLCPKQFIVSNKEFTQKPICTASRKYQKEKIKELNSLNLNTTEYNKAFQKITEKACLCVGLGTSVLINNNIEREIEGNNVSICPGPNMAYFSEIIPLNKMIDHIYGRTNVIKRQDRPNMFVKELKLYINFLKNKFDEAKNSFSKKEENYFLNFVENLQEGIKYYFDLFNKVQSKYSEKLTDTIAELETCRIKLNKIKEAILPKNEMVIM